MNPASNLQIKEVQGAFIIETRDSLKIPGTGNYGWNVLGKNSLSNKWLQSTRLIGIDTLSDFIFNFQHAPSGGPGVQGPLGNAYVQIVMRLTKIGDTTGIIYSARYPLQSITHTPSIPTSDIGTVSNGATGYPNFFIPLTTQEISDFCNGPKYKNRERLYRRVPDQWPIGINVNQIEDIEVAIYPNPASKTIMVEFLNPKIQKVNIKIVNVLGQELKLLTNGSMPAGIIQRSYNISDLSNGQVFLTLEINGQKIIRKLLIYK